MTGESEAQTGAPYVAGCWIIGEFTSRQAAEHAAEIVDGILQQIDAWNQAHEEDEVWRDIWSNGDWLETPTPIEAEIARTYELEWPGALSWTWEYRIWIALDRFVFIQPGWRPYGPGAPVDKLMDRLGGKGYMEWATRWDELAWVVFDLTCEAPDAATAEALYERYLGFFRRIQRNGAHLHFDRWRFNESPLLPDLVTQLQEAGCSGLTFTLTQLDFDQLTQLYDARDVEVMLEILRRPTKIWDQTDAIKLLGQLGDARAVDSLIAFLDSPEDDQRREAAAALGAIGDSRAIEPLTRLLHSDQITTRRLAVSALSRLDPARAIPPIVTMLSDPAIWEQAALALGLFGEAARPAVVSLLDSEDATLKTHAEFALHRIEETAAGGSLLVALRSLDADTRARAFATLQDAPDAVEIGLTYLKNPGHANDIDLQGQLIAFLVGTEDSRVVDVLVSRVLKFGSNAIYGLAEMGTLAVDSLLEMHRTHPEVWVREAALSALAQIGDPRAYGVLVEALNSGGNSQRRIAARGLGKIGDSRAIQPLAQAFFRGWSAAWHPDVDRALFEALRELGGLSELVEPLVERLQTPSWMQGTAARMLGEIGDPRAIEPLKAALLTADERLKPILQEALASLEAH